MGGGEGNSATKVAGLGMPADGKPMAEFHDEVCGSTGDHGLNAGHWLEAGFPRTGWRFYTFTDLGDAAKVCEMCLNATVRFAHILIHTDVPGTLAVGLKCAEVLQNDFFLPEKREREYRTDLRIRRDWSSREWKVSRTGNLYINARGFNIAIWNKGGAGFGVTIRQQDRFDDNYVRNDERLYRTLEEAKQGALVCLMNARSEFRK